MNTKHRLSPHETSQFLTRGWCAREIPETSPDFLNFEEKFREAVLVMKDETVSFFKDYLQDIDGEEFWNKCLNEFPFIVE
jgi:hypothetical protein